MLNLEYLERYRNHSNLSLIARVHGLNGWDALQEGVNLSWLGFKKMVRASKGLNVYRTTTSKRNGVLSITFCKI